MRTLIKSIGHYTLLLTLLLSSLIALSQNSKPTQFKDFPIISNLDSFEQAIRLHKNNSEQYLYDLITLEKNREDYAGWFGQDLDTIKILANQLHSPLAIAVSHYFEGLKLREKSVNGACRNLLEAIHYFESTNDTLGMVKSYYAMLLLSPFLDTYKISDHKDRKFYFGEILKLSQTSSDMQVKFVRIYAISFFEKPITGKQNYKERRAEIETVLHFLDKNPMAQIVNAQLYCAISSFYQKYNLLAVSLKFQLKSYELFKKLSSRTCIKNCLNTGGNYIDEHNYTEAEPILWEGIHEIEKLKDNEKELYLSFELYFSLYEVHYAQKNYKAAHEFSQKATDIQHTRLQNSKMSVFEELQTQYEIDQKEFENNLLLQKNQSITENSRQYMITLYIVLASLPLFGILIYFLYKSNAKQKQLIQFRDQLFAIIAHDMRSPLTAFKGFSDGVTFLMKKGEYDNIRILSQSIDQLIFNTSLLFDNLLNWYALQSKDINVHKSSFKVDELVKESADLYESIARNRQLTITISIPETLTLFANRNALLLILRNLIDNAIKHGKSKKIAINARLEANQVVIEVINLKMTMPDLKLIALQEQMQQRSGVIKEGRSLGLYLVSYFVEQHNGRVSVESSEEAGTRFKVAIPSIG